MQAFTGLRTLTLTAVLGGLLALTACGGDDGDPRLRVLNLSTDLASADLYVDDDKTISGQDVDGVSGYGSADLGSHTLTTKSKGDSAALLSTTAKLSEQTHQTLVLWGKAANLHQTLLDEDQADPDSGKTRLRVLHAGPDIGNLDVYITSAAAELDSSAPAFSALSSGTLSAFSDLTKGSYRLRVTGAGSTSDLRLDTSELTLADKSVVTLVLTAGTGGTLVHAALIAQQGSPTIKKNTQARVRLIASLPNATAISANLSGSTIANLLRSPSVGTYALVSAGSKTLNLLSSGNTIANPTLDVAAGADYSFLVSGSADAPVITTLTEDNRLPTNSSRVKLRLINGLAGSDPMTVSSDSTPLVSDIAASSGSGYATTDAIDSSSSTLIEVTTASASAPLYQNKDAKLLAGGVYSVLVLDGNASATGFYRKER